MSLDLSLVASINHSWLLVSFPGSQECEEGQRAEETGARGEEEGLFWALLAPTGLCTQT